MKHIALTIGITLASTFSTLTSADISPEVMAIRDSWGKINYQMTGDEQNEAMGSLVEQCQAVVEGRPDNAEGLVWCGIVKSTYAGIAGGLSALKYAKAARKDLEKAIEIDPDVLAGSAQTSLGTLYFKVPGWPLGFGNEDKARDFLLAGLKAAPEGIDSNYFYADFLYDNGDMEEAREHLLQAQNASPREGRATADEGRRAEIAALLVSVDAELTKH
jgi:tetratricopeptide (TPR) repeat protein